MGEIGTDENFGNKTGGDRPREHCIKNWHMIVKVCSTMCSLELSSYQPYILVPPLKYQGCVLLLPPWPIIIIKY
jgi:hypothetical protein